MKILFYRYGSICEPEILSAFQSFGLTVIEDTTNIYEKKLAPSVYAEKLNTLITEHKPAFVFSINFFPVVAELCHIHNILYLCWTVDCPVMELFAAPMQYPTNRIFLFDRAQYEYFYSYNPNCIFYLPLASGVNHFDSVIASINHADRSKYQSDISFVGSLYSEKSPYLKLSIPPYIKGYLDGIIESSLQIYGYNLMEASISEQILTDWKNSCPDMPDSFSYSNLIADTGRYELAHTYLGAQAAVVERQRTLNALASHFEVDLYTGSGTSPLKGVHTHGTIKTLTEMPKVFHLSKINLNMTVKSIQTGLPLRIFDILGCGGFLMTNYQAELPEYFEIGKDVEAYSSMDELIDKCAFYLEHDDIRADIARSGYEKVKHYHTYSHRIAEMLRKTLANI